MQPGLLGRCVSGKKSQPYEKERAEPLVAADPCQCLAAHDLFAEVRQPAFPKPLILPEKLLRYNLWGAAWPCIRGSGGVGDCGHGNALFAEGGHAFLVVLTMPRTASPRNSRRSLESMPSTMERWVHAFLSSELFERTSQDTALPTSRLGRRPPMEEEGGRGPREAGFGDPGWEWAKIGKEEDGILPVCKFHPDPLLQLIRTIHFGLLMLRLCLQAAASTQGHLRRRRLRRRRETASLHFAQPDSIPKEERWGVGETELRARPTSHGMHKDEQEHQPLRHISTDFLRNRCQL